MATNDFLPFAGGAGSNVLTQAAYAALAARTAGFSAGVAKSAELNKVWRQASIMSAALAQLIVDNTGADVVDDGTITTILGNLKTAVSGRLVGVRIIKSSGTYTPTGGMSFAIVELVGGGGGSAVVQATTASQTCGTGGAGSGAYAKAKFTYAQLSAGVACTIGTGGVGGIASILSAATNGSPTSFGSLLTVAGGNRSVAGISISNTSAASLNPPGFGGQSITGSGTGAIINSQYGQPGTWAVVSAGVGQQGGSGGSNPLGTGGSAVGIGVAAQAGNGYGSGAGGGCSGESSAARDGAAGANGVIIVWEYA